MVKASCWVGFLREVPPMMLGGGDAPSLGLCFHYGSATWMRQPETSRTACDHDVDCGYWWSTKETLWFRNDDRQKGAKGAKQQQHVRMLRMRNITCRHLESDLAALGNPSESLGATYC